MSTDSPTPDQPNPFEDQLSGSTEDAVSNSKDHSIHLEPWMQKTVFDADSFDAAHTPVPGPADVEHTVWDEPALSPGLSGPAPDEALTWGSWYKRQAAQTSGLDTWLVTVLVVVASAPLALLTSLLRFGNATLDVLALIVIIPATEEILKIAFALWIVEKRPFLFSAPLQILLCTTLTGIMFGFVRHVFSVRLFVLSQSSPGDVTMSILMHTACSFIAGIGLVRIWTAAVSRLERPDLTRAGICGALAVVLHGSYSAAMVILQLTDVGS